MKKRESSHRTFFGMRRRGASEPSSAEDEEREPMTAADQVAERRRRMQLTSLVKTKLRQRPRLSLARLSRQNERLNSFDSEPGSNLDSRPFDLKRRTRMISFATLAKGRSSRTFSIPGPPPPERVRYDGESSLSTNEVPLALNTEFEQNLQRLKGRPKKRLSVLYAYPPTQEIVNEERYLLAYFLCMGIAYVTRASDVDRSDAIASAFDTRLMPSHFSSRPSYPFPSKGSEAYGTLPHQFQFFRFTEYAPKAFRRLRAAFGLTEDAYREEVVDVGSLIPFITNSKSGNFFYFSLKGGFVVKTMTKAECDILLDMLPGYYAHMLKFEDSLLTKFLGLYKIKTSKVRQKTTYFIIMKSVYCYSQRSKKAVHKVFDLKGSEVNRFTDDPTKVKKDLNLVQEISEKKLQKVKMGDFRLKFKRQLQMDTLFLQRYNIMDYSLLFAVHDPKYETPGSSQMTFDVSHQSFYEKNSVSSRMASARVSMMYQRPLGASGNFQSSASASFSAVDVRSQLFNSRRTPVVDSGRNVAQLSGHLFEAFSAQDKEVRKEMRPEYYMGIIDILQTYNIKKKAESRWKGLRTSRKKISAVPPGTYRKRFFDFIIRNIVEPSNNTPDQAIQRRDDESVTTHKNALVENPTIENRATGV